MKESLSPHLARQIGKRLRVTRVTRMAYSPRLWLMAKRIKRNRWNDRRKVGGKGDKLEAKKGAGV